MRLGDLKSGVLTGLSSAIVSLAAALVALLAARLFGRGPVTDGFFLSYGVYGFLVIAAQSYRIAAIPVFTAAHEQGLLKDELRGQARAFSPPLFGIVLVAFLFAGSLGGALTRGLPAEAAVVASRSLGWLVFASALQCAAGLFSSALTPLGNYSAAAAGYAAGAVVAVGAFALLAPHYGIVALAWCLVFNGAISAAVPGLTLLLRLRGEPPARAVTRATASRLFEFLVSGALPISTQAMYLWSLKLASLTGPGEATRFSYAYLLASTLLLVSASSLTLVAASPLTRSRPSAEAAADHVMAVFWISAPVWAGATGVFALDGDLMVTLVLGKAFAGTLVKPVLALLPWMVAISAQVVVFSLLFVHGQGRRAPAIAAASLLVQAPFAWMAFRPFGLSGLALCLAAGSATTVVLGLGVISWKAAALTLRRLGLAAAVLIVGMSMAFGAGGQLRSPLGSIAGVLLFGLYLYATRGLGLMRAFEHVREIHSRSDETRPPSPA